MLVKSAEDTFLKGIFLRTDTMNTTPMYAPLDTVATEDAMLVSCHIMNPILNSERKSRLKTNARLRPRCPKVWLPRTGFCFNGPSGGYFEEPDLRGTQVYHGHVCVPRFDLPRKHLAQQGLICFGEVALVNLSLQEHPGELTYTRKGLSTEGGPSD